jgi:hypothetical protein
MVLHVRLALWPWLFLSALFAIAVAQGCASLTESGFSGGGGDGGETSSLDARLPNPPGDANACRPGDVETYQPTAYHPAAGAGQGVCTSTAIARFYDACLGPQATAGACDGFRSTDGACAACILTPETASFDGPVIKHGALATANVAGCIELTDLGGLPCAKAVQALDGCELFACEANCPVHDQASAHAYDACATQASLDRAGCLQYGMAATACTNAELDGGPAALCVGRTFPDFYFAVVPLFCGSPSPGREGGGLVFDASASDAAADAAADEGTEAGNYPWADAQSDERSDGAADSPNE